MKKHSSSITARAILSALLLVIGVGLVVLAVNLNVLDIHGRSGTAFGAPAPSAVTRTTGNMTFAPATVVDTQRTEGEPINHIDKDGNYWESGPWGFSTEQSFIHRSTDGGNQFNVVSPIGLRPNSPPGGGDTDIKTDDQGNAYFVDLEGPGVDVDCSVSNDNGNTWRKQPACIGAAGLDREWIVVDNGTDHSIGATGAADNTIFAVVRQQPLTDWHFYSSPGSTGMTDPTGGFVFQPAATIPIFAAGGGCGEPIFDPVNRNFYMPCIVATPGAPQMVKSHVNVGQRTGLTFSTVPIPGAGSAGNLFTAAAVDAAGNVYYVWADAGNHNIYYSYSTNAGSSFSTPIQVSSAPANTNVFTWAVAGAAGTLGVVWYGTDTFGDPSNFTEWFANRAGATGVKWYGYAALITNAATASPNIEQDRYTEKPMHYGQVCLAGLACSEDPNADRTMADFHSITKDSAGRMRIVFNDTTNQHNGAQLFEARQLTGPSLIGTTLSASAPSNPMSDPTGDAQWPHYAPVVGPGANVPQLDFTQVALSQPNATTLRVSMTLNNLSSFSPPTGKTNAFWMTRFQALSTGDAPASQETYRIFYVGAESVNGGTPTFFAGSGTAASASAPFTAGNGCVTTTPQLCKVVQYPAEVTLATGSINGNTICIDVPNFLTSGFGAGRPINGAVLYNVTAFSGGRNDAMTDVYADVDATRSFDFPLGNISSGPPLVSVVSRKTHGIAGTFDVPVPLTGTRGVEPRSGGTNGDYSLIFTFGTPIMSCGTASVSAGSVSGQSGGGGTMQCGVNLTGIPNAQYITVTLTGVADTACNVGTVIGPQMGVLLGDVNGDGQVDSADLLKVKQQTLQPVNDNPGTSNFREDVNTDSNIDSGDLLVTKRQTLTGLPTPP
jgi:Dockerin type I domain